VNVILVATVYRFVLESKARKSRPHFDLTITMAALMGVLGFGVRAVQIERPSKTVRVSAVQPNIPREEKFNPEFVQATFDKFTRLSELALPSRPELILWPESSMPGPVMQDEASYGFVMGFATKVKVDLLLGAIDQDEKAAYNAALLVTEEAAVCSSIEGASGAIR
jgi:apolipoprotein N-acyltransferase